MKHQHLFTYKRLFVVLVFSAFGLKGLAQGDSLRHSLAVSYEHTHFSKQFGDDWKVTSLEYTHKGKGAALIGRMNYAERFARQGLQFEAQSYPKLSKNIYAYAGISYSNNSPVFPKFTTGATVYIGLDKGWEVEGGYRQLHFDKSIWVGSGGVSKYLGNWLLNITSYQSLNSAGNSQSYFFMAKRFLQDHREMIWLQAGSGISPDERRNVQLNTANLTSRRLNAGARFFVWKNIMMQLTAGYSRDEYQEETYGNQWNGMAGFMFLF